MKKKWILPIVILSLLVVSVGAVLVTKFGSQTATIEVEQSVTMDSCSEAIAGAGGQTKYTQECTFTSHTTVDAPIKLVTTATPEDGGVKKKGVRVILHAEGTSPREDRIRVTAAQAGLTDLNSLNTISWYQDVTTGYLGHVDVILEDKALVFEYAKVDATNCDNAPYPTGVLDTFGDKGIVTDSSYAWISSGPAGPCGDATFNAGYHNLSDWKATDGTKQIVALEFEVDSWIATTTAKLGKIVVNGNAIDTVTLTVLPSEVVTVDSYAEFDIGAVGTYNLTTELEFD